MLRKIIILTLLINLIFFVSDAMGQDKGGYVKVLKDTSLSEYVDKKVKLGGKPATAVGQHPVLTGVSGLGKKGFQSYLDTKFGQLILVSDQEIKCPGKIKVFGKLEKVSLGGEKGTKSSYDGFVIKVDRFKCK